MKITLLAILMSIACSIVVAKPGRISRASNALHVTVWVAPGEGGVYCTVMSPDHLLETVFFVSEVPGFRPALVESAEWSMSLPRHWKSILAAQKESQDRIRRAIASGIPPAEISEASVILTISRRSLVRRPRIIERKGEKAAQPGATANPDPRRNQAGKTSEFGSRLSG
jgi:hypothetical protein